MTELCHCGRPLHYSLIELHELVDELVARRGPTIPVTWNGRTWLVPRHYIALHGLLPDKLPALGFEEIPCASS